MNAMRRAKSSARSIDLVGKMKHCWSFYQIASQIDTVYSVHFPNQIATILHAFDVFRLRFDKWVPALHPHCLGFSTLRSRLMFVAIAPATAFAAALLFAHYRYGSAMAAIPSIIITIFLVYPSLATSGFSVLAPCDTFDAVDGSTVSFLRVDLRIICGTDEHRRVRLIGTVIVIIYAIALPFCLAVLLARCRRAVLRGPPTPLSRALAFIIADYGKSTYWWEPVEMVKRLALTGFVALVSPGSFLQLYIATIVAICFFIAFAWTRPSRLRSTNIIGLLSSAMLSIMFIGSLGLEVATRFQDHKWIDVLIIVLSAAVLLVFAVMATLLVSPFYAQTQLPSFRLAHDKQMPELSLKPEHRYHMFLSHTWSSGQDQAATIKRQMQLLLPGVQCFLDVDDLEQIDHLERYVNQSARVVLFLSSGFFRSRNCLREVLAVLETNTPFTLVHEMEPSHGGASLEDLMQECPEFIGTEHERKTVRERVFYETTSTGSRVVRPVIQWHRLRDFQLVSLRLMAEDILGVMPAAPTGALLSESSHREGGLDAESPLLYIPGEITRQRITFRGKVSLFASPNNSGAQALSMELERHAETLVTSSSFQNGKLSAGPTGLEQSTHFLLYLNKDTWSGTSSLLLVADVEQAIARKMPVILVHEKDPTAGACKFSDFFSSTPEHLLRSGLYSSLAIELQPSLWRSTSMCLILSRIAHTASPAGGSVVAAHSKVPLFRRYRGFQSGFFMKATVREPAPNNGGTDMQLNVLSTPSGRYGSIEPRSE